MPLPPDQVISMLKELAAGWTIALTCTVGGDWTLEISSPSRPARHMYVGTLESVVARAYAGERGDI